MGVRVRRHIYSFRFKDGTTDDQIEAVRSSYAAMRAADDGGWAHFSMGPNISESRRSTRYNWVVTIDFNSYKAYRDYEESAAHREMVETQLTPIVEALSGVDYDIGDTQKE